MVGWGNYFKLADTRQLLTNTDEWIRRRIRMVFWKKWKRVRTKYWNLCELGASESNTGILANSRKGYWRTASNPILKAVLSNEKLSKAGFLMFLTYYKSVAA